MVTLEIICKYYQEAQLSNEASLVQLSPPQVALDNPLADRGPRVQLARDEGERVEELLQVVDLLDHTA